MRIRTLLALAGATCALMGMTATPAAARATTLESVATSKCLDSNSNLEVYTLQCNGGNYQKWDGQINSTGAAEIKNVATGKCLDSNGRGEVYTHSCNGGNYQRWQVRDSAGAMELKNVATGKCLDSNGRGEVYTHSCNGGNYQRWGGA
ncbi:RICIN domain-containing protein [Streptomyces profundus]|uniref:RICIN domain-containing protein n=1 Tax=Streptomyces profundus TaxID=2867410 RepID=UPI001D16749F|nr:RICIN domain-containing protein [Streptomyces sp. MA3_2.13]UED88168.1 RICIN domain-containing protein [Streptomyces sp. MA3_2.13]